MNISYSVANLLVQKEVICLELIYISYGNNAIWGNPDFITKIAVKFQVDHPSIPSLVLKNRLH